MYLNVGILYSFEYCKYYRMTQTLAVSHWCVQKVLDVSQNYGSFKIMILLQTFTHIV